MNDFKLRKAHEEKVAAENLADAKALAAELEKASVTVKIKVGEGLLSSLLISRTMTMQRLHLLWNKIMEL